MRRASLLILWIAILLRVGLCWVNRDANDNHMEVVERILATHHIQNKADCWQCYHSQLYHLSCAGVYLSLRPLHEIALPLIGKWLAFFAGIGTLLLCYFFLRSLHLTARIEALVFGLVALNPGLIAISAQATNDSFVIFWGTAAIYLTWRYSLNHQLAVALYAGIAAALAAVSKGNGLVLFAAVEIAFLAAAWRRKNFKEALIPVGTSAILFMFLALATSPYFSHYRNYGNPFVGNTSTEAAPNFFRDTYIGRSGTTSIVNSFMTFRFFSLLKDPFITNGREPIPYHRTSLWTQLYGRHHFIRFDQWPPIWQERSLLVLSVGRLSLMLGLIPTLFALLGFWKCDRESIFFFTTTFLVAMILRLNYINRDFSVYGWLNRVNAGY